MLSDIALVWVALYSLVEEANKAEAAVKEATVPKVNQETENLKQSWELIGQQVNSEKLKQVGIDLDNYFNKIRNITAEKTQEFDIKRIEYLSKEAYYEMMKGKEELGILESQNKVDRATVKTKIDQYNANVKKTVVDIVVAKTQGALSLSKSVKTISR